jgi:tetratricopeptide (TPR) repeat protein
MKLIVGLAFTLLLMISGCAGIGVVETNDPLRKLDDAEYLYMRQDRPLIAERLIREATAIYQERGDAHGLANAHREYADLLGSLSGSKWEKYYREKGFQDKTVTFDNRTEKASEYYRKALDFYKQAEQQYLNTAKYDALTNVYFNMAWSYRMVGEHEKSCAFYDKTVDAYNENIKRNPGVKPYAAGQASVPDLVIAEKARAACK